MFTEIAAGMEASMREHVLRGIPTDEIGGIPLLRSPVLLILQ